MLEVKLGFKPALPLVGPAGIDPEQLRSGAIARRAGDDLSHAEHAQPDAPAATEWSKRRGTEQSSAGGPT